MIRVVQGQIEHRLDKVARLGAIDCQQATGDVLGENARPGGAGQHKIEDRDPSCR